MEDYELVMYLRRKFGWGMKRISEYLLKKDGRKVGHGAIVGWIYLGRKPIYNIKEIKEGSEILTLDKAYILGVLCGDGYLTTGYRVGLDCCDKDFVEYFLQCLNNVYSMTSKIRLRYRERTNFGVARLQYSLQMCSKLVTRDLLRYSKSFKSKEWILPSEIKQGNLLIKASFLKGLFDSEGGIRLLHKGAGYLQVCSGNNKSLLEVKEMLESSFGIRCSVKFNQNKVMILVSTNYDSIKGFYDNIGFTIKRKQNRLVSVLNSYKRKGIKRYSLDFKREAMRLLDRCGDHRFVGQLMNTSYTNLYDWEKAVLSGRLDLSRD